MTVIEKILNSLKNDGSIVRNYVRGLRCTAVQSRFTGVASTLMRDCKGKEDDFIGKLKGQTAYETARLALSPSIAESSLGMAALNSLIGDGQMILKEMNAADIIIKTGRGKNVAVIGHFPFTERIKGNFKNFYVIEKVPRAGDIHEKEAPEYLPLCDVVAITAASFVNGTFDRILNLCSKKSVKIILGPTAPFSRVLFEEGFDFICGAKIYDEEKLFRLAAEGASFRQLKNSDAVKFLTASRKENK